MRKFILLIVAMLIFGIGNSVMAYTAELDPGTPLSSYIGLGEWNTPGDFEDWTYNAHVSNAAVSAGSISGDIVGNDPNLNLAISGLPSSDPRSSNSMIPGSVYEIRMRFDAASANGRIDMFPTINGAGPGVLSPIKFADNAVPTLPDIPVDGNFHVYRITLDATDSGHAGLLQGIRFDGHADAGTIGETFEIDYFRIANVGVNPLTVDGTNIVGTSLAEWNTDNDFEGWIFNGPQITSSNVTGGVMSGIPSGGGDPWFYKSNAEGMPEVDLANARYLEFRLKQIALGTQIEIFFGTTNNPGMAGTRRIAIDQTDIPQDSAFHTYRYDMSTHADWNGALELVRIDPYTIATTESFEIDYIRVGSDFVPEPAFLLSILFAGFVMFRKRS